MKLSLQLTALALSVAISFNAQNNNAAPVKRTCGTVIPSQEWNEAFNKAVEKREQDLLQGKTSVVDYTIPVIFHIIHGGQAVGIFPNLPQVQLASQIAVLNADFAGTGFNAGNIASTGFAGSLVANCNVSFCLATKNLAGQTLPEPGIDRVNYVTKGWSNPTSFGSTSSFQSFIDGTVKPATIWDPTLYLNIWVTDENFSIGLLGYATFPAFSGLAGLPSGGTATTDGVWLFAQATGTTPTQNLIAQYSRGRTATHEVGHYLGLRHIGGDGQPNGSGPGVPGGDCTATDYCADTPPQKGGFAGGLYGQNYGAPTYSLPLHANDCPPNDPNGDMFMNFMDYGDDGAIYMFTPNQRARMQTAMANGFYRSSLSASSATQCNNPATSPVAIVTIPSQVCNTVGVITATDNVSTGNPIPTYSWSTNPSAGVTYSPGSTDMNPSVIFPSAGIYTVTCAATNSVGTGTSAMTVTVDVCDVGIAKNSALNGHVSLFPNPSNGRVSIVTNLPYSQTIEILIHNALGQVITSSKHNNVTNGLFNVDMNSYPNGVYFVTISNGHEKTVKRLILNK